MFLYHSQIELARPSNLVQEIIVLLPRIDCTTLQDTFIYEYIADGVYCLQALRFFSLVGPLCLLPSLFVDKRFSFHGQYMLQCYHATKDY